MKHAISWFAIPTLDLKRAARFYSGIFDTEINIVNMGNEELAFFPSDNGAVSGHLFKEEGFNPSQDGVIIYLNGGTDLQNVLDRVKASGGSVKIPKTQITPEIGYYAIFIDSEGNRIALHSKK